MRGGQGWCEWHHEQRGGGGVRPQRVRGESCVAHLSSPTRGVSRAAGGVSDESDYEWDGCVILMIAHLGPHHLQSLKASISIWCSHPNPFSPSPPGTLVFPSRLVTGATSAPGLSLSRRSCPRLPRMVARTTPDLDLLHRLTWKGCGGAGASTLSD